MFRLQGLSFYSSSFFVLVKVKKFHFHRLKYLIGIKKVAQTITKIIFR